MTFRLALGALLVALAGCAAADDAPADNAPAAASPAPASTIAAADVADRAAADTAPADTVVLYKTPTCGCCRLWGDHMAGEGFAVVSRDVTDLQAVKDSLGVPASAASCHTSTVGGYVVEGHVPADQVRRLLRERPDARGIAVAGMPIGSPGMEQGSRRDPYDVLLVSTDGATSVFESIPGTR